MVVRLPASKKNYRTRKALTSSSHQPLCSYCYLFTVSNSGIRFFELPRTAFSEFTLTIMTYKSVIYCGKDKLPCQIFIWNLISLEFFLCENIDTHTPQTNSSDRTTKWSIVAVHNGLYRWLKWRRRFGWAKERCTSWGVHWRHLANTSKRSAVTENDSTYMRDRCDCAYPFIDRWYIRVCHIKFSHINNPPLPCGDPSSQSFDYSLSSQQDRNRQTRKT